jgi:acyl carrier protein
LCFLDTVAGNDAFWNDVLPQRIYSCLETADIFLQQSHQILCSTVLAEKGKHVNDRSDNLVKSIANILRVKDINSIEDDSFVNLGMDSLGYIEVKNVLEIKFDIHLSSEEIRSLTFAKLRNLSISNAKDK